MARDTKRTVKEASSARAALLNYYNEQAKLAKGKAPTKGTSCGAHGNAFELSMTSDKSRKGGISSTDEVDVRMVGLTDAFDTVGLKVEAKTNGGKMGTHIENVLNGYERNYYIVYELDVCNSNTNYIRHTALVIAKMTTFVNECLDNGYFRTDAATIQLGYIKHTNKGFINWLTTLTDFTPYVEALDDNNDGTIRYRYNGKHIPISEIR